VIKRDPKKPGQHKFSGADGIFASTPTDVVPYQTMKEKGGVVPVEARLEKSAMPGRK